MKKLAKTTLVTFIILISMSGRVAALDTCGQLIPGDEQCDCQLNNNQTIEVIRGKTKCCGWAKNDGTCSTYEDKNTYGCGESLGNATVPAGAICQCAGTNWTAYWQLNGLNRGICCGFVKEGDWRGQCLRAPESEINATCGEVYAAGSKESCICGAGSGTHTMSDGQLCCGWLLNGSCSPYDVALNDLNADAETLNALNPLSVGGGDGTLNTPGAIISKAMRSFVFPIAGLILFVVLLLGGFQMLTGAANSKGLEEGKQKITSAIIGFILLFAAYWIAQLLELIFGIRILS